MYLWKRITAAGLALSLALTFAAGTAGAVEDTDAREPAEPAVTATAPAEPEETAAETAIPPEQTLVAAEEDTPAAEEEPVIAPPPVQKSALPVLTQRHVRYIYGFPDRTFRPDQQLTRAQAAQMVYRLLADPAGGSGPAAFSDVTDDQWYGPVVKALTAWGLFDSGGKFRPNATMTRAEFVDLLVRLRPDAAGTARFPDVKTSHWAAGQIGTAAALGWIAGFPDGTFRPEKGLTRAEACTVISRMTGRTGDASQVAKLLGLGLFPDVKTGHWAGRTIVEAAVAHTPTAGSGGEAWTGVDLAELTFRAGIHEAEGQLYYVDKFGKLAMDRTVGAYTADDAGVLTRTGASYRMSGVPYISQIDNIYAWVGCEGVSTLMGLQAKGYAKSTTVKTFLDNLPRSKSDPEKGFVGSPYVPDRAKKTRTTIYPAKLAEYSNKYCSGDTACADFRGASVTDLQRELLAGNCVVGYMTLWWADPQYRSYNIEGSMQQLVSNNHAVLVCGYDPDRGYFISDPYNYYNRGQVHQYWENAKTFEAIWNARKVGMVIR